MEESSGETGVETGSTAPEVQSVRKTGSFVFADGAQYDGEWIIKDGLRMRDGWGKYKSGPESYEGDWRDDSMTNGKYTFATGEVYEGEFSNGRFNGTGTYLFSDGASYSGGWMDSKMHGEGCYTDNKGFKFDGQFFNGSFDSGSSYVCVRR